MGKRVDPKKARAMFDVVYFDELPKVLIERKRLSPRAAKEAVEHAVVHARDQDKREAQTRAWTRLNRQERRALGDRGHSHGYGEMATSIRSRHD